VLRLLAAEPGSFVSVEALDDVALVGPTGNTTLEQTKSVGKTTNPIADRSPELWKTLANWVRAVKSGTVDASRTHFEIFVSRRRRGALAESFDQAQTPAEASAALSAAKAVLTPVGKSGKRRKLPAGLAPHVQYVLREQVTAAQVLPRLTLVFGIGKSASALGDALRTKLISADVVDVVAQQMLGWTKSAIDSLIEQGQPAVISTDVFGAELLAFVRRVDRFAILNCCAPSPTRRALDLEIQSKVYVKQLDLIGSDYDTKLAAANDFLRASVNRSIWAGKGLVHRTSFAELEERLIRTWRAKRDIVGIQSSQAPPEAQGRLVYSECSLVDGALDGRVVPSHFTPGCYHALAERQEVGWHPDYKNRLKQASNDTDKEGK
jgi:hypothetical protein